MFICKYVYKIYKVYVFIFIKYMSSKVVYFTASRVLLRIKHYQS